MNRNFRGISETPHSGRPLLVVKKCGLMLFYLVENDHAKWTENSRVFPRLLIVESHFWLSKIWFQRSFPSLKMNKNYNFIFNVHFWCSFPPLSWPCVCVGFENMIIFNGGHEGINAFFVGKKWLSTMRNIGNTPPAGERIGSFSLKFLTIIFSKGKWKINLTF